MGVLVWWRANSGLVELFANVSANRFFVWCKIEEDSAEYDELHGDRAARAACSAQA